ncbi:TonB-dependent siderophore receptor [Terrihabitans sp. B22-R8]|uniref:TonB-dependent siderophore receptor n=1 Tax=Terrihabitans sp. B22-R8 TaxID=3425128 RepID=UPI00403CF5FA
MACAQESAASAASGATDDIELETIVVHGSPASGKGAATENTNSYTAEKSTIGGKLVLPVKDTPRSLSVLTRKRLDDENITSVTEAVERAPGVYNRDQGDMSDGPFFYSRGFQMSVSEDGVPLDTSNYGPGLDTAIYDRVEVLRGPDGLMQGQGQLGGSVNLVRKAPLAAPRFQTELSAGQWDKFRGVFDLSAPLVESGALRGRAVGVVETRDHHLDFVGQDRFIGYGTLEADITDSTTITLSGLAQQSWINPYMGGLHYPGTDRWTPRDRYIGARWSNYDLQRTEGTVKAEHRFNDDWTLTATTTYRVYDNAKRFAFHNPNPGFSDTGLSPLINRATWFEGEQWTGDAHVNGRVHAFGRTHELAFGANFESFDYESWTRNAASVGLWPVGDPDVPYQHLERGASSGTGIEQRGIYAQARLEIMNRLHAHLGGRLSDYFSDRVSTQGVRSVAYDEDNVFTPYGALVLGLTESVNVYVSYADIFRTQSVDTLDAGDNVLPPIVGEQYEAGIKAALFDGRLTPSLSIFRARDTNRAVYDGGSDAYVAAGEVESRGFEIELNGRILPNWEVAAGYTFTKTEFLAGQPAEIGQRFNAFFPEQSFKLWTNYTIEHGTVFDGLELGLGIRAYSESTSSIAAPYAATFTQPAYAVVDARLAYRVNDSTDLSLNVFNIFDENYLAYPSVRAFYDEPRRAEVKAVMRW